MSVRLWTAAGTPLLADIEEDEPVGYRRRLIGFLPPEERENARGLLGRSGDVRPPDEEFYCTCGTDAEGWIHGDPETYEEDEFPQPEEE